MTKNVSAFAIVLLLAVPAIAIAGPLRWVPAGPYPTKSACQPISFDQPDAIAVDKTNDIYIADDTGPSVIQELTEGGTGTIRTVLSRSLEPIKSGHYFGISLAIDSKGSLYLAAKARGTVEKLNADGTLTVIAGKPGSRELIDGPAPEARLKAPNAIAIGVDDAIYVADTRTIRKISRDGSIVTLAGTPYAKNPYPNGGPYPTDGRGRHAIFMSANGIAVDSHSNIYVADSYDGIQERQGVDIGQIRRVDPAGAVRTLAGGLDSTGWSDIDGVGLKAVFGGVYGVALDSHTILYISEPLALTPAIRRVDGNFDVTTVAKALHTGDVKTTGLIAPAGVAVGSDGILYAADDLEIKGFNQWPVNWLHRIVGKRLETLCREQ